jgi:hypothetical protein
LIIGPIARHVGRIDLDVLLTGRGEQSGAVGRLPLLDLAPERPKRGRERRGDALRLPGHDLGG